MDGLLMGAIILSAFSLFAFSSPSMPPNTMTQLPTQELPRSKDVSDKPLISSTTVSDKPLTSSTTVSDKPLISSTTSSLPTTTPQHLECNATQPTTPSISTIDDQRFTITLCEDYRPGHRVHARRCDQNELLTMQDREHGAHPTTAKMRNDPCAWEFDCRADSPRNGEFESGGKALWWEAALLVRPRIPSRKRCQTIQGGGWCAALHRHVIVIRYPTPPNTHRCYYWRRMIMSYYCKNHKY